MKFGEASVGEWFTNPADRDQFLLCVKIEPIEDKFGNLFVAVSNRGFMVDAETLPPNAEITPLPEFVGAE